MLGTLTVLEATSFSYNDTFVDFERQFSAHQRGAMFVYFSGALSPLLLSRGHSLKAIFSLVELEVTKEWFTFLELPSHGKSKNMS